ncbi:MAG: phosphoribosyltransferase [Gammaproteobacteria bacterium]|nr:phosphoribosyltransferase [Gammaproteobacteria bacterium]
MRYRDRKHAGNVLAQLLLEYQNASEVIVFGMARGGVPVAYEIAKTLNVPLDVLIVRKIGMPEHQEYAIGAIASGKIAIFNKDVISRLNISEADIQKVLKEEKEELARREEIYRRHKPFPNIRNKTVILVDDGVATGFSLRAAIAALQIKHPKEIIIAVPVGALDSIDNLQGICKKVVCPLTPEDFNAVGQWYFNFNQVEDDEVIHYLEN